MKHSETLMAKGIMSYNRRVMQAGEIFLASAVDADYLIRRGQAQRAPIVPVSDVMKPAEAASVQTPVVAVALHDSAVEAAPAAPDEEPAAPDAAAVDTSAEPVESQDENEHDAAPGAVEPQRATPVRVSYNSQRGRRR